jgi:predicted dehydrogenase
VLDAFVSMLGPVRSVYAQLNSREAGPPPLDTAIMTLEFVNGVTGTLATVRATPFYWRVHVFGTSGSAEVLDEVTLNLRESGSPPATTRYSAINVLRAELDAFTDAVLARRPFPVSEAEVLATLSAFEAALQSMASGNRVACDGP